jgi:hypothetical protein
MPKETKCNVGWWLRTWTYTIFSSQMIVCLLSDLPNKSSGDWPLRNWMIRVRFMNFGVWYLNLTNALKTEENHGLPSKTCKNLPNGEPCCQTHLWFIVSFWWFRSEWVCKFAMGKFRITFSSRHSSYQFHLLHYLCLMQI